MYSPGLSLERVFPFLQAFPSSVAPFALCINDSIQDVPYQVWLLLLSVVLTDSSMSLSVGTDLSCSSRSGVPLYITICSSVLLLMDVCVVSRFWLASAAVNNHVQVVEQTEFSFLMGKYLGVNLLGHVLSVRLTM